MAKHILTGDNPEFELVAPVKILVKPSLNSDGTASSVRRRSITSIEVSSETHQISGGRESDNIFLVGDHARQSEMRERGVDVAIQIQDGEKKNVSYYLQHCFRLMYFTGMSTYNPDNFIDPNETWINKILNGLQKVIFWTITFLSLAFAILSAKLNWVIFLSEIGILNFVYVGYWLFAIASDIYFVYLFAYRHKRIKAAIESLQTLGTYSIGEVGLGRKKWKCRNPSKLITVLFAVTIFACFVHPMGEYGARGWTPKKQILYSSHKLSYQLFLWSPDDFDDNSTITDKLDREYGTELTPVTIFMGISEIGMRFCTNMKMDTVQNMGVLVTMLIWLRNRYFGKTVKNIDFKICTDGNEIEELDSPDGLFAEFKQVKKENRLINALAGGLLKIVHAYNLLQCANFLMRCLDREASLTQFAFMMYGLVKVVAIYYFGKRAEAENQLYEEWIREWAMHSRDPTFLARVLVILDGMGKEPLGIGRGNFLVGHGFIFRFIGFVGSIFMLEVDNDDDEDK